MESLSPTSLPRSSSSIFTPHRRSHPNLSHLSLAPLTPKYPIDPADYSPYYDPQTSSLHTSASISHIANLPSPGGILSRNELRSERSSRPGSRLPSRANSRTRKKNKSFVTIQTPLGTDENNVPASATSSKGLGHKSMSKQHLSSTSLSLHKSDSSWLIQTGLTLTEGSRESKGQSWLSKRDSSTSLATPVDERPPAMLGPRSGRNTPGNLSRRSSFSEKRRSRRNLAMTAAPVPTTSTVEPDWADENAQAEIAAHHEEFGNEVFESEDEEDGGDPYGTLDFEGQFDSEDEEELRRRIQGYRLGKWMDGLVDVFLRLEDDFQGSGVKDDEWRDGEDQDSGEGVESSAAKDADRRTGSGVKFEDSVEPPPDRPKSVWDDVAWFGRMVARTVSS